MGRTASLRAQRHLSRVILVILAGFLALFVLFSTGPLRGFSVAQTPTSRFQIQFVNPSGYQGEEEEVSAKPDGTDSTYHLVAWVNELPGTTRVEFHYRDPGTTREVLIGVATQTATPDTFEFHWDPPDTLADGPLTLYALLFDGDTEVARDTESDFSLNDKDNNPQSPNPNETEQRGQSVEITYPTNGNKFGIYRPRDASNAAGVIFVTASEGTPIIDVYYSKSAPGEEPLWTFCGEESEPYNLDDYSDGIICTLAAADEPDQVTAVAAVTNETDEGSWNLLGTDPAEDDSGDAHRVQPYFQEPTAISVTPPVQNDQPTPACSAPFVTTVTDQENHPIYRANVDVHAQGPDDELAFDSGLNRPTQGGHRQEPARNCSQNPPGNAGLQGEHEDPAGPDLKHSETTSGTNTTGTMSFRVYSPSKGDTQITVWSEFDDDDLRCTEEPSANAAVGFLEPAPQPVGIAPDLQTCPDVNPSTTSPSPTDTETTPPPDPRGCTLTGTDQGEALNGTPDRDVICGLGGNDIIRGLGGNDVIYGDAGDDDLRGGDGSDTIQGTSGKDTITGGAGEDILNGLKNNDTVLGGPGSDRLSGNGGIDTVRGNGGADRLDGGPRDDVLTGGAGSDVLFGRGGDDVLSGGPGRDRCVGGAGREDVRGCEA